MRQKLPPEDANYLRIRVFISETTRLLTRRDIGNGFGISVPTLRRYYNPHLRELSRALGRKSSFLSKRNPQGDRERCTVCDIILEEAGNHSHEPRPLDQEAVMEFVTYLFK